MLNLLKCSVILLFCSISLGLQGQGWVSAQEGFLESYQRNGRFDVQFKADGPLQKNWIYGHWRDSDSLVRCVAYREGGRWVPLPFYVDGNSWIGDIAQYGDTMYLAGYFNNLVMDKDSSTLPFSTLLKFYNDSLWRSTDTIGPCYDMEVSGDTLLMLGDLMNPPGSTVPLGPHIMTVNGGQSWQYPYSIPYPGTQFGLAGPWDDLTIRNGSIYALNSDPSETEGVVRWDGQQWHTYGPGIFGMWSQVYHYTFHQNELYITGGFTKMEDPRNPGECIAKWNGTAWESVGGGTTKYGFSLLSHDSILYNLTGLKGYYGDAYIPYIAGWDGERWCGTPTIDVGGDRPKSFGIINDTLFLTFLNPPSVNGEPLGFVNYFDGDYLHGPGSICSSLGLGKEEEFEEELELVIYPNPAKDVLHYTSAKTVNKIEIVNTAGILVKSIGAPQDKIPISDLKPGVYSLQFTIGEKTEWHKLVKR